MEISSDPATITFDKGDIYIKARTMFTDLSSGRGSQAEVFFPEDYYFNDFHFTNDYSVGRINVINKNSKARRLNASVYYSEPYTSTGAVNGLSSFNLANQPYFDYNKEFGAIQSLQNMDDDLIIFHENKVGRVLVGKDILNTASGDGLVSLTRDIIKNYVTVYSGEYGCCLQPESIVKFNDKFYFVDIKKGAVLRLSNDGITPISEAGMKDYFRDLGEMYVEYDPESQDNQVFNIVAGFDPKYGEYIVTFPSVYDKSEGSWDSETVNWEDESTSFDTTAPKKVFEAKTIAFNESLKRWTSFYSFHPEFYSRINNQFVGFQAGYMFKHNVTDKHYQNLYISNSERVKSNPNYNELYNKLVHSSITFPFNAESSSVKNYNAISLESDTKLFASMETNIGQTARGEGNFKGYENTIKTSVGFKKVTGDLEELKGRYLSGNTNPSSGEVCKFYDDVQKGDVVKVYVSEQGSNYYYVYDVVRKVASNSLLLLSKDYSKISDVSHVEVMDYKTKEGIQYAQIPFSSSTLEDDDYSTSNDYNGDGSELEFLGVFVMSSTSLGNRASAEITIDSGNQDLRMYNQSVKPRDMVVGASYSIVDFSSDRFDALSFGVPFLHTSLLKDNKGFMFTCTKGSKLDKTKLAHLSYKIYAQNFDTGKVTFLGYHYYSNGFSKISISTHPNSVSFINNELKQGFNNYGIFLSKEASVEGERIKGSYLMTTLSTKDEYEGVATDVSKYKFNLYSASVDADKSELSGE